MIPGIGHNGGPPLEPSRGLVRRWQAAKRSAFTGPRDIILMRARNAAALGLTYHEYTLELLERGRHLTAADADRIRAIKARRGRP